MTEKRAHRAIFITLLSLLSLTTLLAVGCKAADSMSAADCMHEFSVALNAGSIDLAQYTHSDATDYYLARTTIFWNSNFVRDGTFTYAMSGNTATATEAGVNFVFTLEEDDGDYAIMTITRNGTTIFD